MSGFLVVLEGGEGAGKSTVARLLASALTERGHAVTLTKEPCDRGAAGNIRELLLTGEPGRFCGTSELLMFAAARVEHLRETVNPALARGDIVVCDRFIASTIAYQGYGRGLNVDGIETLHRMTTNDLRPDLTLLLDIPPELGLRRSLRRLSEQNSNESRFEALDIQFHQRVRAGFIAQSSDPSWVVVDGMAEVGQCVAVCLGSVLNLLAGRRVC